MRTELKRRRNMITALMILTWVLSLVNLYFGLTGPSPIWTLLGLCLFNFGVALFVLLFILPIIIIAEEKIENGDSFDDWI